MGGASFLSGGGRVGVPHGGISFDRGEFSKKIMVWGDIPPCPLPWENLVVVLKNCEPELSYILAELFNICLKETCFPDCWKVLWVVPLFKNVGERSKAKNYCPVSLLSVISKVF